MVFDFCSYNISKKVESPAANPKFRIISKWVCILNEKVYFCIPLKQKNNRFAVLRYGAVAQSVEQKTENLCVGGSIPSYTTLKNNKPL